MAKAILNSREIFGNVAIGSGGEPFPDAILTGRTNFGGFFSVDGINVATGNRITDYINATVNAFNYCSLTNRNSTSVDITALTDLKLVIYSCDTAGYTTTPSGDTSTKLEYTLSTNDSVSVPIQKDSAFAYMALIYLA